MIIIIIIIIIWLHRSTTYVDMACCYRPSSVVCRSVTVVSLAKAAEPIDMPFGMWTRVGPTPRKHILDGVTLASPGEYGWTVHVRRRCGLMSNYS